MNKYLKYSLVGILVVGLLWAAVFFIKSDSKSVITYETSKPFISNIEKKTVATGKLIPEDEIEIKPQISGIIEKIDMKEGEKFKTGDLITRIKVVPNELSGGQNQRVAVARGMASKPKVILADELTGALDSTTSYEVMELVRKINDKGNTILVVTHEEDIAHMCKRIIHLIDGVIIKDEKVKQVRTSEYV